jgi:fibronectin type 3 domain-containing protein
MKRANFFLLLFFVFCFSTAAQGTTHSVTLKWSADPSATGGFNIYRVTTTGGPYTKIGNVAASALTYVDTTGTGGTQYFYVVTALDTATPPNESVNSMQVSATFLVNPVAPAGLVATVQ